MNTKRVLIVDNYDSYTWNIHQSVAKFTGCSSVVVPNDSLESEIKELGKYTHIIIGPGPGNPTNKSDVGDAPRVIELSRVPVLGICLGHQLIATMLGGSLEYMKAPSHGIVSPIMHEQAGLFYNVSPTAEVVRYHSIVVQESNNSDFKVTARSMDDEQIVGLQSSDQRLFGVQFHPESILTSCGKEIFKNFLNFGGDT